MTLSRYAALFWSVAAALVIVVMAPLRWWHPYCSRQDDGPGYYASGFPLPFAEPTGVSSMESFFLPLPFVLDVLVVAAVLYAIAALVMRHRAAPRPGIGFVLAFSGSVAFTLLAALLVLTTQTMDVVAWRFPSNDSYFSYRPAPLVAGARLCDG